MRRLIATVFNYSLVGPLADEGTEFGSSATWSRAPPPATGSSRWSTGGTANRPLAIVARVGPHVPNRPSRSSF